MIIDYSTDVGAGTLFEAFLQKIAGTKEGITSDDTVFTIEGYVTDVQQYHRNFGDFIEYPMPCIIKLLSVKFVTLDNVKHELKLDAIQSDYILHLQDFFTTSDYAKINTLLLKEHRNQENEFID